MKLVKPFQYNFIGNVKLQNHVIRFYGTKNNNLLFCQIIIVRFSNNILFSADVIYY